MQQDLKIDRLLAIEKLKEVRTKYRNKIQELKELKKESLNKHKDFKTYFLDDLTLKDLTFKCDDNLNISVSVNKKVLVAYKDNYLYQTNELNRYIQMCVELSNEIKLLKLSNVKTVTYSYYGSNGIYRLLLENETS
jgi:hypothetical protein